VRASINLVNETSVFGSTTGLAFSTKGDVSGAPSEAMRINASGNVGIGTTSPQFQLHVNSDSSGTSAIGVGNTGSGASRVYLDASNGDFSGSDYMWIGQNNDLTGEIFMAQNAGSFYIKTQPGGTSTVQLAVTQAGQVGIGTTSPGAKLHVTDSIRIDTGGSGPTQSPQAQSQSPTQAIIKNNPPPGSADFYLSEPDEWLMVDIGGTNYVLPAYEA